MNDTVIYVLINIIAVILIRIISIAKEPCAEPCLEVSLFELAPHPFVDVRLADVVFIPPDQQSQDWSLSQVVCCKIAES